MELIVHVRYRLFFREVRVFCGSKMASMSEYANDKDRTFGFVWLKKKKFSVYETICVNTNRNREKVKLLVSWR